MAEKTRDIELRRNFKLQLVRNPNYFGNLTDLKLPGIPKSVLKKIGDTTYEELTCLGYNPDGGLLTAIVEIKQGGGYNGDICEGGSREYVRFYLDYGDGTWVDHGVANFDSHDLGFDDELCYAVSIAFDPEKRTCCDRDPVLPRVRAILSWNVEPPANMPNWLPVWGNRLARSIQIEPRSPIFCCFLDQLDLGVQKIDPNLVKQIKEQLLQIPKPKLPPAPLPELVKMARSDDSKLAVMRTVFPLVTKLAADKTDIAAFQSLQKLKILDIDLAPFDDFILKPNFNTTYEELHCVGLDRDAERLHGVIQIKRSSGYSGDLCTNGSREYIAFYIDFGSGWEYQGTTWVDVHDIPQMPSDGLWYHAYLNVNLEDDKKKWCEAGKARLRGILSWAVPPAPNQPNFVPHWGDREDCDIEIRPLPKGIPEGILTPSIQSIGSMAVDQIDAAGFATGPGLVPAISAEDSPFGGTINFAGMVHFAGGANLEYRVMVRGPSDPAYKAVTKTFVVKVETATGGSTSIADVSQTPAGEWYNYIPQVVGGTSISVIGDLLFPFTATEDGLHHVYLEVRNAGGPAPIAWSSVEAYYVNNKRPSADVEITSGVGNCGKFGVGEVIAGTYSLTADYADYLSISVTPTPEAGGGTLVITSAVPAGPSAVFPVTEASGTTTSLSLSYRTGELDTTGVAAGAWELDTTGMDPCGYNIRIYAEDRTIVDSASHGWPASDIEGFCVEEA